MAAYSKEQSQHSPAGSAAHDGGTSTRLIAAGTAQRGSRGTLAQRMSPDMSTSAISNNHQKKKKLTNFFSLLALGEEVEIFFEAGDDEGNAVVVAVNSGDDDIGVALARFDEGIVHRFDGG